MMTRSVFLLLSLYAGQTLACSLARDSNVYTEVSVGCKMDQGALQADLSVPASVNQREGNGGECRVQNESGEQFFVEGSNLVIKDANGIKATVGTLKSAPSCYRSNDTDYPNWTAVEIFDTNPPPVSQQAESRTEKVVCYEKVKGAFYGADGAKQSDFDENSKVSESILKVWKLDGTEYRTTEGTALRNDGTTIQSLWRSFSIKKETVQGDLTVETFESNIAQNWTGEVFPSRDRKRLQYKRRVTETTWQNLGNGQRLEKKVVLDGKEKHAGAIETVTKNDDGSRVEKVVEQTPYREDFDGGSYANIESEESTCTFTPVQ